MSSMVALWLALLAHSEKALRQLGLAPESVACRASFSTNNLK